MRDEFLAPLALTLTCVKCTRTRTFGVADVAQGRVQVARAGWIARGDDTICPRCPQSNAERAAALLRGHPEPIDIQVEFSQEIALA